MRRSFTRISGLLLISGAVIGALLCVAGLLALLIGMPLLHSSLQRDLAALDESLTATGDGLATASVALGETEIAVATLRSTLRDASQAITDTLPTIDTLATLTGEDLPEAVRSTQTALAAAQNTALIADGVLAAVARLPIIGSGVYNPAVPLNVAIGNVSTSLDSIPPALANVERGLGVAHTNLQTITGDLDTLAASIGDIGTSLTSIGQVIARYQTLVNELQTSLDRIQGNLTSWMTMISVVLFLLLLWFAAAQVSLFMQGLWLLRG
jgi:hypothetical protein